MRAFYVAQMKLVYLNNFYNQRRQQMLYAAYIFAQNKLKYNNHLQHQQYFANELMQKRIHNAINNKLTTCAANIASFPAVAGVVITHDISNGSFTLGEVVDA